MAAVKSNKPTAKLKAGKKKPLNKWIIVGGVAAVALVGALIVRFSSASQWYSVKHLTGNWTITTASTSYTSATFKPVKGRTYRICFRGGTSQGTAVVNFAPIQFQTYDSSTGNATTVRTGSNLYCSKSWKKTSSSIDIMFPTLFKLRGYNVNFTALSVDELR